MIDIHELNIPISLEKKKNPDHINQLEIMTKDSQQEIQQVLIEGCLKILKDTAKKNNELDTDAKTFISDGNIEKYKEKIKERADLLVLLPDQLKESLEGLPHNLREKIESYINHFSSEAKNYIEEENWFKMSGLLTHIGSNDNDLLELIHFVEFSDLSKLGSL